MDEPHPAADPIAARRIGELLIGLIQNDTITITIAIVIVMVTHSGYHTRTNSRLPGTSACG